MTFNFPTEISLLIFSNLDIQDLGRCSQVSHLWNNLANDRYLLNKVLAPLKIPAAMNIKAFLAKYAENSLDGVTKRIDAFFNQVPNGTFTCFFPLNPRCTISVDLSLDTNSEALKAGYCFLTKRLTDKNIKTSMTMGSQRSTYYSLPEEHQEITKTIDSHLQKHIHAIEE